MYVYGSSWSSLFFGLVLSLSMYFLASHPALRMPCNKKKVKRPKKKELHELPCTEKVKFGTENDHSYNCGTEQFSTLYIVQQGPGKHF